jgi:HEAT repeat protein
MRLSKCAAGILVLVLFAIVAFAVWPQRKEPEYHGRKLSALLLEMVGSGSEAPRDSPLGKAIVEIGTNGIPFYLDWIRYDENLLEAIAASIFEEREKKVHWKKLRRWGSVQAFRILGEDAQPAIPSLVQCAGAPNNSVARACSFECLAHIAVPAVPSLVSLMTNGNSSVRLLAVRKAALFGSNAIVRAQLERLLTDPDMDVRTAVSTNLTRIWARKEP